MSEIDFTTALARVLRDAELRESFAHDPAAVSTQIRLRNSDRAAFEHLVPTDLEAQARVLLRKRYREVADLLPTTCATFGADAWKLFRAHALQGWPSGAHADALDFCEWLRDRAERFNPREYNRLRFIVHRGRFAFHLVKQQNSLSLPHAQILIRRGERISECALRFAL